MSVGLKIQVAELSHLLLQQLSVGDVITVHRVLTKTAGKLAMEELHEPPKRYFDQVKPSRVGLYGFVGWIISFAFFLCVLLWAFAPQPLLEGWLVIGQYLPDR